MVVKGDAEESTGKGRIKGRIARSPLNGAVLLMFANHSACLLVYHMSIAHLGMATVVECMSTERGGDFAKDVPKFHD